jgi:4-hydroxybenzoate polyprenyltransferase
VISRLRSYAELVMFSHSIFSFSFAVLAFLVASRGRPSFGAAILVVLAFLGGRTCANALNRVADRRYDAENPRTAGRHLPAGTVSVAEALAVAAVSFLVLAAAAFLLDPLCAALLPAAGALFLGYSYTKRFTWACHAALGVVCAGASVGAWLAVRGGLDWPVLVLAAANAAWVAGFDVIYAIQDIDYDRRAGLHSFPARFGPGAAMAAAAFCHLCAVAGLAVFGAVVGLGPAYFASVAAIAALLAYAWLSARADYGRNALFASYSANQVVSFILLAGTAAEFLLGAAPEWRPLGDYLSMLREALS